CRPPFFITTSRFTLPVGVGGVSTENQKNRIKTEANALRKVYAKFRLNINEMTQNIEHYRGQARTCSLLYPFWVLISTFR
ncbi:MAG: hypothetical protein WAT12_12475, partial [Candidatus Nitrotoga sp.]